MSSDSEGGLSDLEQGGVQLRSHHKDSGYR